MTYLAQRTQANHAAFADYINPFNLALRQAVEAGAYNLTTPQGLTAINGYVPFTAVGADFCSRSLAAATSTARHW